LVDEYKRRKRGEGGREEAEGGRKGGREGGRGYVPAGLASAGHVVVFVVADEPGVVRLIIFFLAVVRGRRGGVNGVTEGKTERTNNQAIASRFLLPSLPPSLPPSRLYVHRPPLPLSCRPLHPPRLGLLLLVIAILIHQLLQLALDLLHVRPLDAATLLLTPV